MPSYVAFIRGINVGGNNKVTMADLKSAFAALKFTDIKTILASGNVVFTAPKHTNQALARKVSLGIAEHLGRELGVIVRSLDELKTLAAGQPFKRVKVTPDTRLYVTFFDDKPTVTLKTPWVSPEKDLKILTLDSTELISVLTLSASRNSGDAMSFIEKQFGKGVTTRNWNTIEKILKAS